MRKELIEFCAKLGIDPQCETTLKLLPWIEDLFRALNEYDLYPQSAGNDILEQCAFNYVRIGQLENAIKFFKLALINDPNNPDLLAEIGFLTNYLGNSKEAKNIFESACNSNPRSSTRANYELALIYLAEGNYRSAIEHFTNVLNANVIGVALAHVYRGIAYHKLGRQGAHKDFCMIGLEIRSLSTGLTNDQSLAQYLQDESFQIRVKSVALLPQKDQLATIEALVSTIKSHNNDTPLSSALEKLSITDVSVFNKKPTSPKKVAKPRFNPWNMLH